MRDIVQDLDKELIRSSFNYMLLDKLNKMFRLNNNNKRLYAMNQLILPENLVGQLL